MTIRELLRELPAGLPADALLARIKGRRSFLVQNWDRLLLAPTPLATLSPAPWRGATSGTEDWPRQALQQEYYWVFARMEEELRKATAPFFWLAEVRTLAIALRLVSGGVTELEHLLSASLLAKPFRDLLHQPANGVAAVDGVANLLAGIDPAFREVSAVYQRDGVGALEAALTERSLHHLASSPLAPPLRSYITLLIDSRNLTTIAKRLRWRLNTLPPLLEGGTLPLPRLTKLFQHQDKPALLNLAMRLGGQAPYDASADLEAVLYAAQGRVLRRLARGEEGIGAILHYLCCCSNEAVNIALLQRLETAGSAAVERELRR
jgi:hypothetical protein